MRKSVIIAALVGWGLALLLSPRDVLGMFKGKSS